MSYLEEFLEKHSHLPIETYRGLKLIRELDEKVQEEKEKLDSKINLIQSNGKYSKDKKILEEIQEHQSKIKELSYEKKNISTQLIEQVDHTIQRLDGEIKRFEEEIKNSNLNSLPELKDERNNQEKHFYMSKKKKSDRKGLQQKPKFKSDKTNELYRDFELKNISEPLYCYCQSVSYGQMIACDDQFCEKEWFHSDCIIDDEKRLPTTKEKWFCRDCRGKQEIPDLFN